MAPMAFLDEMALLAKMYAERIQRCSIESAEYVKKVLKYAHYSLCTGVRRSTRIRGSTWKTGNARKTGPHHKRSYIITFCSYCASVCAQGLPGEPGMKGMEGMKGDLGLIGPKVRLGMRPLYCSPCCRCEFKHITEYD